MLSNDEINNIVSGKYSDELIDKLRKWYTHEGVNQVIKNLSPQNLRSVMPVSFVQKYIDINDKEVLEIGCGTGQNMVCYSAAGAKHVYGIDIDPNAVEISRLRCKEESIEFSVMVGDCLKENFGGAKYHIINCIGVLEHVSRVHQEKLVMKMLSLLRPGGILFIQVPNKSCIIDSHDSKLPFAHWIPRHAGERYARFFGRTAPQWNPMHYTALKKMINNAESAEILNNIDVCDNVKDFIQYRLRQRKTLKDYVMVFFVLLAYPFLRNNINIILPNVNLIIRKG